MYLSRLYFLTSHLVPASEVEKIIQRAREHRFHICFLKENPTIEPLPSDPKDIFLQTREVLTPYLVKTSDEQESLFLLPPQKRWIGEFDILMNLPDELIRYLAEAQMERKTEEL